jgi:hypothetical protein
MRGDLPDREVAYALIQDHVKPGLLFLGTEFGLYVTLDEGMHWHRLKGGFPTIQVRDLEIQRDWNDLAVATFGRGFYILDDYTPLRQLTEEVLAGEEAILFPAREALLYVEQSDRVGDRGQGFWTTSNPPYGAVFTYWLREGLKTRRELRIEAEQEARESETDEPVASLAELREEDLEVEPTVFLVVRDDQGSLVRRVKATREAGLQRVAWDLRWPPAAPTDLTPADDLLPWETPERGPLALPGVYTAALEAMVGEDWQALAGPVDFAVVPLDLATLTPENEAAVMAFREQVRELRRAILGASRSIEEADRRVAHLRQALVDTPEAEVALLAELEALKQELDGIRLAFEGDRTKAERNVFTPPSLVERVERIASDQWYTTQAPTTTHEQAYAWASEAYEVELGRLQALFADLESLEERAEAAGAPWTPGRIPGSKR